MDDEKNMRKQIAAIRKFQAVFLGVTALGLSMAAGDLNKGMAHSVFSDLTVIITMFGFMGSLLTEYMARKAMKW